MSGAPVRRPWLERIGLAAIALVLGGLFAVIGVAAFAGGEPFLGLICVGGALATIGMGARTVIRG